VGEIEQSSGDCGHPPLSVAEAVVGTDVVLQVTGEVDLSTGELFRCRLERALTLGHRVVLDLRGVEFMDSTGLNTILRCQRRAEGSETVLLIRAPSRPVQRLFQATGVLPHLTFDTSR
jgi:anti-sigma B factor antagonist